MTHPTIVSFAFDDTKSDIDLISNLDYVMVNLPIWDEELSDDQVWSMTDEDRQLYFEYYCHINSFTDDEGQDVKVHHHLDSYDLDYSADGTEAYDDDVDSDYRDFTVDEVASRFQREPSILQDAESIDRR